MLSLIYQVRTFMSHYQDEKEEEKKTSARGRKKSLSQIEIIFKSKQSQIYYAKAYLIVNRD